jgi:hypothetical protein
MLFRPHLRLLRGRLIAAAVVALGVVLIEFMATVSDDLTLGAFWHQACTCPVDPSDVRILLSLALDFVFIAGILGYMSGTSKNSQSLPQPSSLRFMLTRPQSRLDLILAPFLIAATAITLLPGLAWLLLIGWLYLVHAPSLGHLVAILETIPAASHLGPHPSFLALAAATHMGRFYLAGISVGLCVYIFLTSSRWLMQSRFISIKIVGLFSSVFVFLLIFALRFAWMRSLLFSPPHYEAVTYLPSQFAIALHFAFALAWFYGTLRIMRDLEL